MKAGTLKLQMAVCALVTASFTNIYLTQPILPVLQAEFGVTTVQVFLTVSAVILGIVLSNLFFGVLSDKAPIHPILLVGGFCVALGGIVCAVTHDFRILVGARFFQGLFLPALTTSLAAWLSKTLPKERLSVVMGGYVAATAVGLLNQKLANSQGRANSLYVLFYYAGGWIGITGAGFGFERGGWGAMIYSVAFFLVVPLFTGIMEKRALKK